MGWTFWRWEYLSWPKKDEQKLDGWMGGVKTICSLKSETSFYSPACGSHYAHSGQVPTNYSYYFIFSEQTAPKCNNIKQSFCYVHVSCGSEIWHRGSGLLLLHDTWSSFAIWEEAGGEGLRWSEGSVHSHGWGWCWLLDGAFSWTLSQNIYILTSCWSHWDLHKLCTEHCVDRKSVV